MDTLRQVLQLIEVIPHLLLTLELGGHHAGFKFLLLGVGAGLPGFAGLLEELEAVGHGLLVHADSLLEDVQRPRDDIKLADHFLQSERQLLPRSRNSPSRHVLPTSHLLLLPRRRTLGRPLPPSSRISPLRIQSRFRCGLSRRRRPLLLRCGCFGAHFLQPGRLIEGFSFKLVQV